MTYENEPRAREFERAPIRGDEVPEDGSFDVPRLGHDIRFVFAAVGGGAIRVGREVARHHLRYVETVAINCDPSVQDLEEFDRRVYLGPDTGARADTHGSPAYGAEIARAAAPALERIFEGSTFVTILGSLGGGSGTGALPYVLEAAARSSRVLSVFVVKPFKVEGDRRAVAERALARLHFIESFVDKQERGAAKLQVLDNESLLAKGRTMPFKDLNAHWARVVAAYIDRVYIAPSEAVLEDFRLSYIPTVEIAPRLLPPSEPTVAPLPEPFELGPLVPRADWDTPPAAPDAEVTIEIDGGPRGPDLA
jgi:Tubulin/FtsZ family, GTPase domain